MRYTIVWDPTVESHFLEAWLASDSETREILTQVASWIDTTLANDPDQKGIESSDFSVRILPVPVSSARVSVVYQVVPDDRIVQVVRLIFQDEWRRHEQRPQ